MRGYGAEKDRRINLQMMLLCMQVLVLHQWAHVPAFERGNVATVVLVQNVSATEAFVS